jgi:hypothetical protein
VTTPAPKRPRWPPPKRGDLLAIAFVAFVLVVLLVVGILRPASLTRDGSNFGFGPDMECTGVGYGAPVCIRKLGAPRQ